MFPVVSFKILTDANTLKIKYTSTDYIKPYKQTGYILIQAIMVLYINVCCVSNKVSDQNFTKL